MRDSVKWEQPGSRAVIEQMIRIEEHAGIDRKGEAVRFGIPFAQGEWPADAPMGLVWQPLTGAGRVLSCEWQVTQVWPDGSARLALCTAEIELDSQAILGLTPSRDSPLPSLSPSSLAQMAGISCRVAIGGENREQPLALQEGNSTGGAGDLDEVDTGQQTARLWVEGFR